MCRRRCRILRAYIRIFICVYINLYIKDLCRDMHTESQCLCYMYIRGNVIFRTVSIFKSSGGPSIFSPSSSMHLYMYTSLSLSLSLFSVSEKWNFSEVAVSYVYATCLFPSLLVPINKKTDFLSSLYFILYSWVILKTFICIYDIVPHCFDNSFFVFYFF